MKKHLFLKSLLIAIGLLVTSLTTQMWADPWVKNDVSTGLQGTKTVGDKLNGGSEWWYNYRTNGGWSSATDIQVLIGTSTSSYSTVNAEWYADDGGNKKVHANIGSFTFDKSGLWYAVGKYYASSKTAYTSGTSFTSNSSLSSSMSTSNSPYWKVNPPSVKSFAVSTDGSDILSGSGTSADPYIIAYNGSLVLSLSGSKNKTDENSSLQYNTAGTWNSTTSRTISSITSTTKTSVTVKMRCYNSTASLSGTESSKEIYYQSEASYSVTAAKTPSVGGSVTPSSATTMGTTSGGDITASPNTGYTFTSWAITSGSGYFGTTGTATTSTTANTKFRPSAAATVTATFTPKTYSLTLDGNGGSDGSATATYNSSTLTSFTGSSRASYDLNGYFTATSGGTKVINADGTLVASAGSYTNSSRQWIYDNNVELHAQWTYNPVTYSVTYAVGTGYSSFGSLSAKNTSTSAAIVSGSSLESGTGVTFTATPNTGYVVEGWYTNAACTADKHDEGNNTYSTTLSGNITVYVKFVEKTWSVAFAAGTGGTVTTPASTPKTVGQVTGISIAATPATGYTFNRWTSSDGGSFTSAVTTNSNTFKPTANTTVTASFNEKKSTITVTTATSSQGTLKFGSTSQSWGATASLGVATTQSITATAASGYKFVRWDLTGAAATSSSTTSATITLKADGSGSTGTATAVFEEDLSSPWVLKGGTNITGDNWATEHAMTKKTGHSTENVAYYTANISSTNSGTSGTADAWSFKLIKNSTWYGLTAEGSYWWKRSTSANQSLTTSSANIQICADVAGTYEIKVDYSTATPKITVTFPTKYTVTYSVSPSGAANAITTSPSVTSGGTVAAGTSMTFTHADAKTGYSWYRWENGSGSSLGTGSTYTTTINANTTVVAKYTENSYNVTVSAGSGGSVSPTGTVAVKQVSGTSLTATPSTNYVFDSWTISGGGITPTTSTTNPQTFKATTTGGTIRANFADKWNLKGDQWDSWGTYKPLPNTGTNTFSTTLELVKGTTYQFKVVQRGATDTWYGNANNAGNKVFSRGESAFTTTSGGSNNNLAITPDVSGTYTFSINTSGSTPTITITYQSAYTVTFGYGTGGSAVTASGSTDGAISSGNYVKAGDDVTFAQTPSSSGYTFKGWYTAASGGTAVSGMSTSDNVLDDIAANATVYAQYTANNYTVTFDKNGGTTTPSPSSKSVTFGAAYGSLPGGMTHTSKTFVGWYTDPDDGEGDLITAETIVRTASDHTLYAHYENVYSVNVNFKSGSTTIYPSTSVNASPTSLAPTITAPEIFGYSFVNWTGSNATFGNPSSATTTVNATAATTVTANYNVVPTVYFKNNLGWDSVFVSFDITWTEKGGKQVPVNKGKPYYKMTQIGSSDIYYCVIPSTYTASNYTSWSANIAFDNTNYGKTATTTHSGTWDDFYGGEFTGRGDFDPKATLFIPYKGDKDARNGGTFYQTGCWMKYNSTESGYQVNMNTWVNNEHGDTLCVALTAASAGGYEFSAKLNLKHPNYTYGFKLYKIYQKSDKDLWYTNTGTIYANTETLPWDFHSGTDVISTSTRCGLHTEALGDYTITVSFGTGRPMVNVEYPTQVGDWRLAYNDLVAWSGDTHDASWHLYSRVIKAKANAVDTVSFYVSKATGANASVELQKCTKIDAGTGAETWTKQGSNLDLSSIPGTGIYNFKVTQNGSKDASAAVAGGYEGNFYIRTDVSDGGWTNYKNASNVMTYSEYAKDHSGFTHYFMRYVETGGLNIKFCIANDYSPRLTEYCIDDDYTGEHIATYGNVRFMWDHRTNKVSRAYISGSAYAYDRFLVLEGDAKLFDKDGKALTTAGGGKISGLNDYEMNFSDDQNWIYEATVEAIPGAKFKLTAKYNNKIQYFYGDEGSDPTDSVLLLGGSDGNKYPVRVVYDFKTNRLIKAFLPPDNDISADLAIEADLMIIREHQEDAKQITFTATGKLSEVKTVYGAMKFNKYTVNGKSKESGHASTGASRFERDLFYISFPFDVKLNEAFGFGTYGQHWIIEYYDGKGRAANGFWADSDPNWKFVTPSERNAGYTMKAFEGYILALDLDELTESSDVWKNGVENVYIYFPSSALVKDIAATNRLVTIDQTGYECTINRNTPDGDRRVKDSYWHCIGVPSFANYSSALYDTNGGTLINWSDANTDSDGDQWTTPNLPYLYEVDLRDKSLSVTSTNPFHFKATWSYLVQYEKSSIYWSNVNVTPAAIVARERKAPTNAEFRIELQQAGKKADQTFVRLTDEENITTGFDFNYDLSKEFNKNKANIYTMVTTVKEDGPSITEVAGNVQPMTEQTTVVPMGVTIAKAGEYTISIPSGTSGIGVTLVDNETGIRTNLALEDYTVALEAGTQNDRFYLEISPIKHVATGVEEITGDGSQVTGARKVMVDGILYIIKDGKVFSTQGARVK